MYKGVSTTHKVPVHPDPLQQGDAFALLWSSFAGCECPLEMTTMLGLPPVRLQFLCMYFHSDCVNTVLKSSSQELDLCTGLEHDDSSAVDRVMGLMARAELTQGVL